MGFSKPNKLINHKSFYFDLHISEILQKVRIMYCVKMRLSVLIELIVSSKILNFIFQRWQEDIKFCGLESNQETSKFTTFWKQSKNQASGEDLLLSPCGNSANLFLFLPSISQLVNQESRVWLYYFFLQMLCHYTSPENTYEFLVTHSYMAKFSSEDLAHIL